MAVCVQCQNTENCILFVLMYVSYNMRKCFIFRGGVYNIQLNWKEHMVLRNLVVLLIYCHHPPEHEHFSTCCMLQNAAELIVLQCFRTDNCRIFISWFWFSCLASTKLHKTDTSVMIFGNVANFLRRIYFVV